MNRERMRRNLNPHQPARCAMYLFPKRYALQGGGSMDFWDSLSEDEQKYCRSIVDSILDSDPEDPNSNTEREE